MPAVRSLGRYDVVWRGHHIQNAAAAEACLLLKLYKDSETLYELQGHLQNL